MCRSQNQMKSGPIRRRSLLGIRRLRWRFSFFVWSWISVSSGQHGLRPRQPTILSVCPLLCGRLAPHRWQCCPQTLQPVPQRWDGLSMSRHARRSCRLPAAFQARSVPGSSAYQKLAAPFLPVCRSRGCRSSSKYHQEQHLRPFPRRPHLSHRMVADCGYLEQLSDILPQGQSHSYTFWKTR